MSSTTERPPAVSTSMETPRRGHRRDDARQDLSRGGDPDGRAISVVNRPIAGQHSGSARTTTSDRIQAERQSTFRWSTSGAVFIRPRSRISRRRRKGAAGRRAQAPKTRRWRWRLLRSDLPARGAVVTSNEASQAGAASAADGDVLIAEIDRIGEARAGGARRQGSRHDGITPTQSVSRSGRRQPYPSSPARPTCSH